MIGEISSLTEQDSFESGEHLYNLVPRNLQGEMQGVPHAQGLMTPMQQYMQQAARQQAQGLTLNPNAQAFMPQHGQNAAQMMPQASNQQR